MAEPSAQQLLDAGPAAPAAASVDAPVPLGGYVGVRTPEDPGRGSTLGAFVGGVGRVATDNIYYEGDERNRFIGLPTEEVYRIQQQLIAAGLLTGPVRVGIWDASSTAAMRVAMEHANATGMTWEDAANAIASESMVTVEPRPLVPNRASLMQAVRDTYAAELGRQPTNAELDEAVEELEGGYEAVPEQQILEEGEEPATAESIQANFQRFFQNKYASEIEGVETAAAVQAQPDLSGNAVQQAMFSSGAGPSFSMNDTRDVG